MKYKLKLQRTKEQGATHNANMTIIVDVADEAAAQRYYDECSDRKIKSFDLIAIEKA